MYYFIFFAYLSIHATLNLHSSIVPSFHPHSALIPSPFRPHSIPILSGEKSVFLNFFRSFGSKLAEDMSKSI